MARQVPGVVDEVPVARRQGDLLEGDDVGGEPGQDLTNRVQALGADEPPPSVRERLPRPDGGADVPGRDAQSYLTDPASRPCTK